LTSPQLSVVIPAYNEAARLPATLRRIGEYLRGQGLSHEILVVDDGSGDGTAEAAREAGGAELVVVRNQENRGKGYSVRRGMLLARGERRLMSDADLSTPIEELPRLEAKLDEGYDVAIASRAAEGARIEVHQPWFRENVGRLFNLVVRALAVEGLKDTQCGFKLFSAEAARESFSLARLDGFSFDVEALYIARAHGLRIAEVPVVWRNDAGTRVGLGKGARAFLDVLQIRWNASRGRYSGGSASGL
jgi:dolichyl-phosphate beta-glucosyltransferase